MAKKDNSPKTSSEPQEGDSKPVMMPEPQKGMFREVVEILMYGLALLLFFKGYVWQNFQIPTSSMENTLLIGDHITANTFIFKNAGPLERTLFPFRDVKRGDVVVFKYPGAYQEDWIKRCIGVPGDNYEVIKDQIMLNDSRQDEPYTFYKPRMVQGVSSRCGDIGYRPCDYYELKPGLSNASHREYVSVQLPKLIHETRQKLSLYRNLDNETYDKILARLNTAGEGEATRIPEGFYLMMGDNRNNSHDSRAWGLVPREFVEGRAYFVWWSYGEDENSHTLTGWAWVKSYLRVPIVFFKRTHWKETFSRIK